MAAATSEALERVSAERRARWLRRRRRRRVLWVLVGVAAVAALAFDVWPRGGTPAQPPVKVAAPPPPQPARPLSGPRSSIAGLLAALPTAAGVAHGNPGQRMVALTFDDGPSGRTPRSCGCSHAITRTRRSSSSAAPRAAWSRCSGT